MSVREWESLEEGNSTQDGGRVWGGRVRVDELRGKPGITWAEICLQTEQARSARHHYEHPELEKKIRKTLDLSTHAQTYRVDPFSQHWHLCFSSSLACLWRGEIKTDGEEGSKPSPAQSHSELLKQVNSRRRSVLPRLLLYDLDRKTVLGKKDKKTRWSMRKVGEGSTWTNWSFDSVLKLDKAK